MWPVKLKIYAIWTFTGRGCLLLFYHDMSLSHSGVCRFNTQKMYT